MRPRRPIRTKQKSDGHVLELVQVLGIPEGRRLKHIQIPEP